jgi:RND family efflux transporter MFP subunit
LDKDKCRGILAGLNPRTTNAAVFGLLLALWSGCSKSPEGAGSASGVRSEDGGSYEVRQVEERLLERAITTTGSLLPLDRTPVSVKVPGRLEKLLVDLGSTVKQGDLIAQVEDVDYSLRVAQAEAALWQARSQAGLPLEGNDDRVEVEATTAVMEAKAVLDEARANRERIQALAAQGILSASDLETANATFKVATSRYEDALQGARTRVAQVQQRRAEYRIALQQREDTRILAPYDGAVQERLTSVGAFLSVGAPVVSLVRTDPLRLRVEVAERDAARVRIGQPVRVTVEQDANVYTGRVSRLSPAIVEGSRTLVVEADVSSMGRLRPGSFARAQIVTVGEVPARVIPEDALVSFAGIEKVFVVEDGLAVEKRVVTGDRGPGWVEVVEGLAVGERLVMKPGNLQTGQRVTAVSPAPAEPGVPVTSEGGAGGAGGGVAGS